MQHQRWSGGTRKREVASGRKRSGPQTGSPSCVSPVIVNYRFLGRRVAPDGARLGIPTAGSWSCSDPGLIRGLRQLASSLHLAFLDVECKGWTEER